MGEISPEEELSRTNEGNVRRLFTYSGSLIWVLSMLEDLLCSERGLATRLNRQTIMKRS